MYDGGHIDETQYAEASAYDITKDFIPAGDNPIEKYPYLTFEVEKRAIEVLTNVLAKNDGYEEKDIKEDENLYYKYRTLANQNLRQNGYEIHTTINKEIYDVFQDVKNNYKNYGPDKNQEKAGPRNR